MYIGIKGHKEGSMEGGRGLGFVISAKVTKKVRQVSWHLAVQIQYELSLDIRYY